MSDAEIRIVKLEKMRVASVLGFGTSPELEAWEKILNWAGDIGLLEDHGKVRFFGFDNPDTSKGSPNYGYEQWITISPESFADALRFELYLSVEGGYKSVLQYR